ncbi:hypothetical protein GCM10009646_79350 [Streptomyces aureus]
MSTDSQDSLPREPSAWRPGNHFGQKFKDADRHLDGEIVRGCIERGAAKKVNRGVYQVRETFGGVTFCLALDAAEGELITGYPDAIDVDVARESGRWSPQQIRDIETFIANDPR